MALKSESRIGGWSMVEGQSLAANILRNAIEMELEGQRLFEEASERMKHPHAKEVFLNLVKQEMSHVQIIGHELHRIESGLGWSSLETAKSGQEGYPRISVFDRKGIHVTGLNPDIGELEVINLGIEVEKKSIDYYRDAGSKVDDQKAREIFNWLVNEEAGHLLILKAEYDSRSGSGFYYDDREFSLEVE